MTTKRSKQLRYAIIIYFLFLGSVAAYRYTELHHVYANERQAQPVQMSVKTMPNESIAFLEQQLNVARADVPVVQADPVADSDTFAALVNVASSSAREEHSQPAPNSQPATNPQPAPNPQPATKPVPKPAAVAPSPLPEEPINNMHVDMPDDQPVPKAPSNLVGGKASNKQPIQMTKDIGNVSFGVGEYYDTNLGSITKITGSGYLGNKSNAGAVEINVGPRIARLNLTYGLAFTDKQRVKLSAERLDERLDYGFETGPVRTWEGQSAIGASYDYALQNHYIKSLGISGYLTHSGSKDLPDVEDGLLTEERRIAGANSGNLHFDVVGQFWPYSRISGGADYDAVRFNTRYNSSDQDVHGFGGHAKIEQRLLPSVKFTAQGHWQQVDNEYVGALSWLMPSPRGMQFELEGSTDFYDSLATHRRFYTNGARLNVHFGGVDEKTKGVYSDLSQTSDRQSLLDWTRTPAVRMTEVLAIADSALRTTTSVETIACPAASEITCSGSGMSSTCTVPADWTVMPPTSGKEGDSIYFKEAYFNADSKFGECKYIRGDIPTDLILIKNDNLGALASENWNTNGDISTCSESESTCLFADKRYTAQN